MEGLGFSRPQDSLGTPGPHRMQIESHDNRAQRCVKIIAYGLGVLKWGLNNIFSNHAQERGGIDRLLSERSVNDMLRQSESSALITGLTSTQKKAMASDEFVVLMLQSWTDRSLDCSLLCMMWTGALTAGLKGQRIWQAWNGGGVPVTSTRRFLHKAVG